LTRAYLSIDDFAQLYRSNPNVSLLKVIFPSLQKTVDTELNILILDEINKSAYARLTNSSYTVNEKLLILKDYVMYFFESFALSVMPDFRILGLKDNAVPELAKNVFDKAIKSYNAFLGQMNYSLPPAVDESLESATADQEVTDVEVVNEGFTEATPVEMEVVNEGLTEDTPVEMEVVNEGLTEAAPVEVGAVNESLTEGAPTEEGPPSEGADGEGLTESVTEESLSQTTSVNEVLTSTGVENVGNVNDQLTEDNASDLEDSLINHFPSLSIDKLQYFVSIYGKDKLLKLPFDYNPNEPGPHKGKVTNQNPYLGVTGKGKARKKVTKSIQSVMDKWSNFNLNVSEPSSFIELEEDT